MISLLQIIDKTLQDEYNFIVCSKSTPYIILEGGI